MTLADKMRREFDQWQKLGHGWFFGYSKAKGKYVIKKWRKK